MLQLHILADSFVSALRTLSTTKPRGTKPAYQNQYFRQAQQLLYLYRFYCFTQLLRTSGTPTPRSGLFQSSLWLSICVPKHYFSQKKRSNQKFIQEYHEGF